MVILKRLISVIVGFTLFVLGNIVFMFVAPFYWIVTGKELEEWAKKHDRWDCKILEWEDEFLKEKTDG